MDCWKSWSLVPPLAVSKIESECVYHPDTVQPHDTAKHHDMAAKHPDAA